MLGAFGAALVLVPRARVALLAGLVVTAGAEVALGAFLVGFDEARALVESPARVGLTLVAGLAVLAGGVLFARFPAAVPVALLAAAPFRVPVGVGGEAAFLLLPLYGVLASTALALAYRAARNDGLPAPPRALAVPVALFVALAAISLLWSQDVRSGAIQLAFVLFPFALLVAVLARAPFPDWLPRALAAVLVSLASAFALLGLWQLRSRDLVFAPEVEAANAYTNFFRVTAVFKDPSIYGRHLAVAIVVVLVALWVGRVGLPLGAAVIALLSAGLFFAYSQSSLVALFVGVLATTLVVADPRSRRIVVTASLALALIGGGVVVAAGKGDSLRRVTSGRSDLVVNTTEVIRDHPLIGVGLGAERQASRERAEASGGRLGKASHTTVLTVAAELGLLGVAAHVAFLLGAVALFAAARRRDEALGVGLGAVFLVIFVHSAFYSGFFEDPLMWGTMGVAAAAILARAPVADVEVGRPSTPLVGSPAVVAPKRSTTA